MRRVCGYSQGKGNNVVKRDVADFRVAGTVNASATVGRIEAEHGAQPYFHEIGRAQDCGAHSGIEETLLAITLGCFEWRVLADVSRIGGVDKVLDAGSLSAINQSESAVEVNAAQAVVLAMRHGGGGAEDGFHAGAGGGQCLRLGQIGIEDFGP